VNNVRTLLVLMLAITSSSAWALNMSVFQDAPISRLTGDEVKEYVAVVEKTLDATADGTTVEWKAPKTNFVSKITPQKSFNDGESRCREATIESDSKDRYGRGSYTFCKGTNGRWQFKLPSKPRAK